MGGLPLVGYSDTEAHELAQLAAAGIAGIAVSPVNYPTNCPIYAPRLGTAGVRR
jgi:hypothetical protein